MDVGGPFKRWVMGNATMGHPPAGRSHRASCHRARLLALGVTLAGCTGSTVPRDAAAIDADVATPPDDAATLPLDAVPDAAPMEPPCHRTGPRPASAQPAPYNGPHAPIEVLRDTLGIPHVYGQTDGDAVYGEGYVQAVDRLYELEVMRRAANGTLAAWFGAESLSQDRLVHEIDLPRWGRESADRLQREDPALFTLVNAWVAGVNRRIAEVTSGVAPRPAGLRPGEYDLPLTPWTVDDTVTVSRLILFRNANQLQYDLLASLIRKYIRTAAPLPLYQSYTGVYTLPPEERPAAGGMGGMGGSALRPQDPGPAPQLPRDAADRLRSLLRALAPFQSGGSNNWAVDGRFTANGRPMIAGDPHQPLMSPSVFWANHVNSAAAGGTLDAVGFSFVGTPGIDLGHNAHVAWTATTSFPDTMDVWDVSAAPTTVHLGSSDVPFERCTETLAVNGQSPVAVTVEDVPGYGVLLPDDLVPLALTAAGHRLLFNWVGFRATVEAEVFFGFDRATSLADWEAAAHRMETGAFHLVAADATGISYVAHALVPDRGAPATLPPPNALLDGNDPRTVWRDGAMLDDTRLPHSHGGVRGFLCSGNNDPFGFTANGRIDDDPWYYGVWFDPGTRAARIEGELTRLTARGGITTADFEALQADTHSLVADDLLPTLAAAWASAATDPTLATFHADARLAALVAQLGAWNRNATRDASAAVVYEGYVHFLARDVLGDDLSVAFDTVLAAEPIYVHKWLMQTLNGAYPGSAGLVQGGRTLLLLQALAQTRDWLVARFGGVEPTRYAWSAYHTSDFAPWSTTATPFVAPTVATPGTEGTVSVSSGLFYGSGSTPAMFHQSKAGAAYRMIATFAADGTPQAEVAFARGNSGDPASPHFADTLDDWLNGRYRPLPFARADVEAASPPGTGRFTLAP